jgi:hypothetical protein
MNKITRVELYQNENNYSAKIILNDLILLEASGNKEEAIWYGVADPEKTYWRSKESQEIALKQERDGSYDFEAIIEELGFENNIGWLEDNATITRAMRGEYTNDAIY